MGPVALLLSYSSFDFPLNARFDHISYLFWAVFNLMESCVNSDSRKGKNFVNIWTATNMRKG